MCAHDYLRFRPISKKSTATIDVTRCNAGLLLRWFVIEFSSSSPARGLKAVVNLASSTYRDNGFYKRINSERTCAVTASAYSYSG